MTGAEQTKSFILTTLSEQVIKLQNDGCKTGAIHTEQLKIHSEKLVEMSKQLWWLITICFVTLISVAFQIGLTLDKVR